MKMLQALSFKSSLRKLSLTLLLTFQAAVLFPVVSSACTSVIVSGKARPDGKPVMYKHRDTDHRDTRIVRFQGEKYALVGSINCDSYKGDVFEGYPSVAGEIWAGMNEKGFCIMNTATYDLKDDEVPEDDMGKEGMLMFRALEICADQADFERFLDTLSRPMGVETNLGIIDAFGAAAYYEVNNGSWTKFDVNDDPRGYCVVTNFTRTGRPGQRKGVDRFVLACSSMKNIFPDICNSVPHEVIINNISRSGKPILREISSSAFVFEGVKPGSDPFCTVMWSCCGWPGAAPCLPVMVLDGDHIDKYMKGGPVSGKSAICSYSLEKRDAGEAEYETMKEIESVVDKEFYTILAALESGKISRKNFVRRYEKLNDTCDKLLADRLKMFKFADN